MRKIPLILTLLFATPLIGNLPTMKITIEPSEYGPIVLPEMRHTLQFRTEGETNYELVVKVTDELTVRRVKIWLMPTMKDAPPEEGTCPIDSCDRNELHKVILSTAEKALFHRKHGLGHLIYAKCKAHDPGWAWTDLVVEPTAALRVERAYYKFWWVEGERALKTHTSHYLHIPSPREYSSNSGQFKPYGTTAASLRELLKDYCGPAPQQQQPFALVMQFSEPPPPPTRSKNAKTSRY